ncbi:MAG: GntR family transcriptional regulator [Desulfobacterales bacterium]|nr:GntR family transcriptional regulator [Desulfobacterales bacterium]
MNMGNNTKIMERMLGSSVPFQKLEHDRSPVYFQLAKKIQQQIETGKFVAGELIPSERKIASYNNLSLATVRKALDELYHKKLVKRVQGKGTYVTGTADRYNTIRFYPFVESFSGSEPMGYEIQLIDLEMLEGQTGINHHLKIRNNQKIYRLRRIISHIGKPLVYCTSYLPKFLFPGLDKYDRNQLERDAIYLFLEREFGVTTVNHSELLSAAIADRETAEKLDVKPGDPLLKIEKLLFTHKEKPYEYRLSYCITDQLKLRRAL